MPGVNFYFQSGDTEGTTSEQRLIEDLIIESINIKGHNIYYLPRTSVNQDNILGEDRLSQFTSAYPIPMYLANVQGWDQQQELFTKFGIEVKDTATFIVSKRRWEEAVAQQAPTLQLPTRPAEGDLLYFPKTDATFEIKFVEHMDPFYQLGKFYVYSLQCELYQYSSEIVQTGIPEIDDDFANTTADSFGYAVLTAAGNMLIGADGGAIINETFDSRANERMSNNTQFEKESVDIIDFSVENPFGEV